MPLAICMLGIGVFVLGTSEFMIAGLLPPIATDLNVSIPDTGLLISAFAIGMLVGAPTLAAATIRLPRKPTLLGMLAIFMAAHIVSAISPNYDTLFAAGVTAAVAAAGFWAVGTATTVG